MSIHRIKYGNYPQAYKQRKAIASREIRIKWKIVDEPWKLASFNEKIIIKYHHRYPWRKT